MSGSGKEGYQTGLETRHVFLDTDVFRSCGHNLNAELMKVFGEYVADGILAFHTTDVTLREVSRQLVAMQKRLSKDANRVARDLHEWNSRYRSDKHKLAVPDRFDWPKEPSAAYLDFEKTLRRNWLAEVHSVASLTIGPVLERYFNRQAPFDSQGSKEFPDAIALFAVEDWCARMEQLMYVVSKDKAVLRAAKDSRYLIGIGELEALFAIALVSAEYEEVASEIPAVFEKQKLLDELGEILSASIDSLEVLYDGDRLDGEALAIKLVELEEVEDVTVVRVAGDEVVCVAHLKLVVSAEIGYADLTFATWDREDQRYYGVESGLTDIQDSVVVEVFVSLARGSDEIALSSAQFLTQELTVTDFNSDGYPYK